MKLLLIEDDPNKCRQLEDFVRLKAPNASLFVRKSYSSGLKAIREIGPDLVILDMSLPNFDGELSVNSGRFRSYGGRDILQQLARRSLLTKVVVVTQYEAFSSETNSVSLAALAQQLAIDFPSNYLDTIFYNASQDDWKSSLAPYLEGEQ